MEIMPELLVHQRSLFVILIESETNREFCLRIELKLRLWAVHAAVIWVRILF